MNNPTAHREIGKVPRQPLDLDFPLSSTTTTSSSDLAFFLSSTGQSSVKDLQTHASGIQKEAYEIYSYPCIRRWAFMTTKASKQTVYDKVLDIGKSDPEAIYLDAGCFTGTDVRKLVYDGWNADRVIGTDLRKEWFDLGYKLYNDRESCPITFLPGDIFDPSFLSSSPPTTSASHPTLSTPLKSLTSLNPLHRRIKCISTFSFFHLFPEPAQTDLAVKLSQLLVLQPGSIIFGAHQAKPTQGLVTSISRPGADRMFCHSPDSWKEMWQDQVFPQGVRVEVKAEFKEFADLKRDKEEAGRETRTMMWSVTIV